MGGWFCGAFGLPSVMREGVYNLSGLHLSRRGPSLLGGTLARIVRRAFKLTTKGESEKEEQVSIHLAQNQDMKNLISQGSKRH